MNSVKKRALRLGLCLLLIFAMLFGLWLRRAISPKNEDEQEQRIFRQYMLTEYEALAEGTGFDRLYKSDGELVIRSEFGWLWFFPFEDKAALFPGTVLFWSPDADDDPDCRAMELYAYDEIEGAASVELEFWLRYETGEDGEIFEMTYTPRCTDYNGNLATFLLVQSELSQREFMAFNVLSNTIVYGEVPRGVSYRATLRYYDGDGKLLCEVVQEET